MQLSLGADGKFTKTVIEHRDAAPDEYNLPPSSSHLPLSRDTLPLMFQFLSGPELLRCLPVNRLWYRVGCNARWLYKFENAQQRRYAIVSGVVRCVVRVLRSYCPDQPFFFCVQAPPIYFVHQYKGVDWLRLYQSLQRFVRTMRSMFLRLRFLLFGVLLFFCVASLLRSEAVM